MLSYSPMKLSYYFLMDKLTLIIKYQTQIAKSNPTYYNRRVEELLREFIPSVPLDAPEEFRKLLAFAYHLHCEMMEKGRRACSSNWIATNTSLKKAKFLLSSWLEAQALNSETPEFEKMLLGIQKEVSSPLAADEMTADEILARAEKVERVMDVSKIFGQSNGGEQAITSQEPTPEQRKAYESALAQEKLIDESADDVYQKMLEAMPDSKKKPLA